MYLKNNNFNKIDVTIYFFFTYISGAYISVMTLIFTVMFLVKKLLVNTLLPTNMFVKIPYYQYIFLLIWFAYSWINTHYLMSTFHGAVKNIFRIRQRNLIQNVLGIIKMSICVMAYSWLSITISTFILAVFIMSRYSMWNTELLKHHLSSVTDQFLPIFIISQISNVLLLFISLYVYLIKYKKYDIYIQRNHIELINSKDLSKKTVYGLTILIITSWIFIHPISFIIYSIMH